MKNVLVKETKKLLEEYDYPVELSAIESIIDKALYEKATIIEAFKKHPNYVENDLMIAVPYKEHRDCDSNATLRFYEWVRYTAISTYDVPDEYKHDTFYGMQINSEIYELLYRMTNVCDLNINDDMVEYIKRIIPEARPHSGQKLTRVARKIFGLLRIDKHPDYEREFAKWADAVTPRDFNRTFVLSVNPIDFYTMSFGNSWASCHTIDKNNKRNMPNNYQGCYSSGTESYMLDSTSIITYTVDEKDAKNVEHLYELPKINRQMFHYSGDKLVQGRLYPQDNDSDLCKYKYDEFRHIVQEVISGCFTLENYWSIRRGTSGASEHIASRGTHYHDYEYYDNCTLSTAKNYNGERIDFMTVGHNPICPCCGIEHSRAENICCYDCTGNNHVCSVCGYSSNDDGDGAYIDGEWYCWDCCSWCDSCQEYHIGRGTYIEETGECVCEDCLEEFYAYCENCGEWHLKDNCSVDGLGNCVCNRCLSKYYCTCPVCGEYYKPSDMSWDVETDKYICNKCHQLHRD